MREKIKTRVLIKKKYGKTRRKKKKGKNRKKMPAKENFLN